MAALTVAIGADVFNAGITDDGEEFHAERFYVQVEAPDGSRWTHTTSFPGTVKTQWDDGEECGFYFPDNRTEAMAQAEKLAANIKAHLANGGTLNPACWVVDRPAYGSEAYQTLDAVGYFKALEIKEEFDKI